MTSQEFGALIRARREAKGLSVEEIATRIKLSARTLRSIEDGVFDGLPHAVYARGFIRSYALCAGLTPEETDEGINTLFPSALFDETAATPGPIDRQRNAERRRGGDRIVTLLLMVFFLVLPLAAGWFVYDRYGTEIFEIIKKPFSAITTPPQTNATQNSMAMANTTAAVVPPRAMPSEAGSDGQDTAARAATVSTAAIPVSTVAAPQNATAAVTNSTAAPQPAGPVVAVIAKDKCWVQTTADGDDARTTNMEAGDTAVFPFSKKLVLTLGNAGGVTVRYNGTAFPVNGRNKEKKTLVFPPRP